MLTRRTFAGLALAAATGFARPAHAQSFKPDDLAVPGPLGDVVLGKADAPVTIYEYASMTCSHCAHFHDTAWPVLKQKYIETGKVRFVLREFPLDPLATAGFMLARCAGNDKYYAVTDLLFDKQKDWAFTNTPVQSLAALVKQAGFTQESFEACLKNQSVYEGVMAVRDRGVKTFNIDSTPTFFINGTVYRGAMTVEDLDKALQPLVGG
jgi:protein-disulfide isomerase